MRHNRWTFAAAVLLCCAVVLNAQDNTLDGVRRITLPEAQARANQNGLQRAAQLEADAAKYHRRAVQADYYPKVGATFANLHFNKFMGDTIPVGRRAVDIPLLNKD